MHESFRPGSSQSPDVRHQRTQVMGSPDTAASTQRPKVVDFDKLRREDPEVDRIIAEGKRMREKQGQVVHLSERLGHVRDAYAAGSNPDRPTTASHGLHERIQDNGRPPVIYLQHNPFGRMERATPERQRRLEELARLERQIEDLETSFQNVAESNNERGASIDTWLANRSSWKRKIAAATSWYTATLDTFAEQHRVLEQKRRELK